MATSVYFNGKMRTLPGVYSTITSGESNATRNLDYGVALLIDTGNFGKGFGGGSGVEGEQKSGKDAVYEFYDIDSFRDFVKGGMFWKAAEALFKPDPYNPDADGISKLLYVRACSTTAARTTLGNGNGTSLTIKTIDEGTVANGNIISGILEKGYAYTIEPVESENGGKARSNAKFIVKFWRGTYTGKYRDPVTGFDKLSYDELTLEQSAPLLICQSPECANLEELADWCSSDENFNARFVLESAVFGANGNLSTSEIAGLAIELHVFEGGAEDYQSKHITQALKSIVDVEYNIVFTDQIEGNAGSKINLDVIAHRNTEAKFDKFVFIGAYASEAKFEDSLALAQSFNNAWVCTVHGGVGTASAFTPTKFSYWGVFYNLCQVIGRVLGKPPYIPATNKTIGGDKLYHIPTETQMERAIKAGLIIVYPNPYLKRFVILQAVTTLQDNKLLFNKKGDSFSLQFMRILAQLNKECVVNAEIDLLGDENGVNINTLSKGALETWTINFLQQRVATDNQDNLILKFQNVQATKVDDYYKVTYEVVVNNEVTKVFFTGFLLRK